MTIIEKSLKQLARLPQSLVEDGTISFVNGDGATTHALRQAEIEEADTFVAITGSDTLNGLAAQKAQEIFGVPAALQTHEHRRMAKAINYGVVYGLSAFGLAQRTGASRNEAQEFIDEYFRRYQRVKQFLDRTVEEVRNAGQVQTLFGRLRPIPEIRSKDPATRNRAEREAVNTPVQGTAADLLKLAMIKLNRRIKKEKLRSRMILTVHDELVFEVTDQEQEKMKEIVRAEMEQAYPLRVPLKVDMGIGPNWKEAK